MLKHDPLDNDYAFNYLPKSIEVLEIHIVRPGGTLFDVCTKVIFENQQLNFPVLRTIAFKNCDMSFLTQNILQSLTVKNIKVSNNCKNLNVSSDKITRF
jgi:hypothetical protein